MSKPKRHHFVPQAYLARFGRDERVRVRTRGRSSYVAHVRNVAVESGFYTTARPDGGESTVVEEAFSQLETAGASVLRGIDSSGEPPPPGSEDRRTLAIFLAVQSTRTPQKREHLLFPNSVARYAGESGIDGADGIDKPLIADFLEKVYLGFRPSASEVGAAWDYVQIALREPGVLTKEFAIEATLGPVNNLLPAFLNRRWVVEIARKPRFLTSDAPLVLWSRPSPRDAFRGIGLQDAEEIRFPLDPEKQLVLALSDGPAVREVKPSRV